MDPEAQGAPTPQDPQATPDPAPAAPAPVPAPTGPWADKLTRFEDPATRLAVDEFLRSEIQPYVTRLEQRPDLPEGAAQLWNGLTDQEQQLQTYLQVTSELYGPEAAEAALQALQGLAEDDPAAPAPDQPPTLDPRVEALIERQELADYEADRTSQMTSLGVHADWADLVDPLVVAQNGDLAKGIEAAKAKLAAYGIDPSKPPAPTDAPPTVDDVPNAPPVAAATPPAVPTEKTGQSLDEAMDEWFAERRAAQAPPTIGGV